MSSLWGALSRKNTIYVKEDDLGEYEYGFTEKDKLEYIWISSNSNIDNQYFTLIKREQPYKFNIRLNDFYPKSNDIYSHPIYNLKLEIQLIENYKKIEIGDILTSID